MICPNCGCSSPENARFCIFCGQRLPEPPASPVPPAEPDHQPAPSQPYALPTPEPPASPVPSAPKKRGTHWIPLLIMGLLCIFGLTLFFALPFGDSDPGTNLQSSTDADTPWFYNTDGTLYFFEELYTGPDEITIPETVSGLPVESIGSYCFYDCDWITTVILPDTVQSIETSAFAGCTALRAIFLPEGVTYIGTDAFYDCAALESICIPSTMETIEPGAFDGCIDLSYILYSGSHSRWKDLYGDYISYKTQVYCNDGNFVHRKALP